MQVRTIENFRGDRREEARYKRIQRARKTAMTETVAFQGNGDARNIDEGLSSERSFDDSKNREGC